MIDPSSKLDGSHPRLHVKAYANKCYCVAFWGVLDYPSVAIVHEQSVGKFKRGSRGENICLHEFHFSIPETQKSCDSEALFRKGLRPFEKASGLFQAFSKRPQAFSETQLPGASARSLTCPRWYQTKYTGWGCRSSLDFIVKVFHHYVWVTYFVWVHFGNPLENRNFLVMKYTSKRLLFTMVLQLRTYSQHQRPFDTLWNTRTISGFLERSIVVAK